MLIPNNLRFSVSSSFANHRPKNEVLGLQISMNDAFFMNLLKPTELLRILDDLELPFDQQLAE